MIQEGDGLDFSTILASSVHDMKNSLGMVLFSLEEMIEQNKNDAKVQQLHYDVLRVNNYLIQLLSLYKMDKSVYPLHIADQDVAEFIEEQISRNHSLIDARGIQVEVDVEPGLVWFFDQNLLVGVVNNILANTVRYSNQNMKLSAYLEDEYLVIRIEDDGRGYPENLLGGLDEVSMGVDFVSGSTGFGLYFTHQVAQVHENNGRRGFVKIENNSQLGGGCFSLYLP